MKISMRFPAFKQPPTSLNSLLEASSRHTVIQWVKTDQTRETKVKPPSRSPFHHASLNGIDAITKSRRLIYFIQCTIHTPKICAWNLKKKKKYYSTHWMHSHDASHKAEKNLTAQREAVLTQLLHFWALPSLLQGSSIERLQRINQNNQITTPVAIKNHRFNAETFTVSNNLLALRS